MTQATRVSLTPSSDTQNAAFAPTSNNKNTPVGEIDPDGSGTLFYLFEKKPTQSNPIRFGGVRAARSAERMLNEKHRALVVEARQRIGVSLSELEEKHLSLASLRLRAGLSQSELAEKLGTKQSNISRWEHQPVDMKVSTVISLAGALGVSPSDIFDAVISEK